jgi:hypothetical protein
VECRVVLRVIVPTLLWQLLALFGRLAKWAAEKIEQRAPNCIVVALGTRGEVGKRRAVAGVCTDLQHGERRL